MVETPYSSAGATPASKHFASPRNLRMSRSLGNVIADSLELGLGYAERLLAGVTPDQFARFAAPGGQQIASNHGAFLYGHLALYSPRIVGQLGGDAAAVTPPARYGELFSKDAVCRDDPSGTLYPSMDEIVQQFFGGYRAAVLALRGASDAAFAAPNPLGGPLAERFPTLGSMHAFYAGGHLMVHLGQMSAWRRMWGLPAA
jgi:hypothetical protein